MSIGHLWSIVLFAIIPHFLFLLIYFQKNDAKNVEYINLVFIISMARSVKSFENKHWNQLFLRTFLNWPCADLFSYLHKTLGILYRLIDWKVDRDVSKAFSLEEKSVHKNQYCYWKRSLRFLMILSNYHQNKKEQHS